MYIEHITFKYPRVFEFSDLFYFDTIISMCATSHNHGDKIVLKFQDKICETLVKRNTSLIPS